MITKLKKEEAIDGAVTDVETGMYELFNQYGVLENDECRMGSVHIRGMYIIGLLVNFM